MINYSIVMRSVNANLLAINQAKSRINQAKKEGKEPVKEDLELVKTEKQNAFAISQYTDIMTIEKFAKHITSHGSVYSRADISAILYMAVDCMREMLLEGKKIRLGDLGDFSVLLSSKGAEDPDKFTAQNITDVKVQWEPGQQFKTLRDEAEFNLVASRSAQAAVLKAIKEGKTSVDLNAPTTPEGGGDGTAVAVLLPEVVLTPVALVVRIPEALAATVRAARVPAPKAVVVRWASSFKAFAPSGRQVFVRDNPGRCPGLGASALYLSLRPVTVGSGRVGLKCET